jgi:hypothetical protein
MLSMNRCTLLLFAICLPLAARADDVAEPAPAPAAAEALEREKQQDVLLRAMVDELERNQAQLKLEGLEAPYYLEYTVVDAVNSTVACRLGAVERKDISRVRPLITQVRVGSYDLDNTNFRGGGYYSGIGDIPIEDDYNAIRQAIWWATDRNYKQVVETFAQKLAFMKTKVIEDKPNDFSREAPVCHFEPRADIAVDMNAMEALTRELSNVFRKSPAVQRSRASARAIGGNRYYVNTEGTRLRTADLVYWLTVSATVQADDGMPLRDSFTVYGETMSEFPSPEALRQRCHEMVTRLVAVRDAPKLDAYTGPVLFESEAAASLFLSRFGDRFAGGQRGVGRRTPPDDFSKKIGRRILPRSMQVVDDPTSKRINGRLVLGHYTYDDQGVASRPVTLVEKGRLQAQVMSRNPSRQFAQSTGHGRNRRAQVACLKVSDADGADPATLRQELIEACQDEGLEYGIRIARLGGGGVSAPLEIYKVFPDGREELVRGAEVGRFDLKAFKRLLAAGDEPHVLNETSGGGQTIVAPAMLFEELDLAKMDRDFDKPPILPTPLARQVEPASSETPTGQPG